jgi:hypothetical protein
VPHLEVPVLELIVATPVIAEAVSATPEAVGAA